MSRKTIMAVIWIALTVWGVGTLRANNIRVGNVASGHHEPAKQELYVAFDLSWDNSWRNEINWDAAWVFVKFRAPGSNLWEHAFLSTNSVDHLGSGREIEAAPDGMGVFIYASGEHTGTVNYVNTRLLWQYGTNGYAFSHGDAVEISVHAIEMVYVPEGSFYVGSGGEETGSFTDGAWAEQGAAGSTIPYLIGDAPIEIGAQSNKLWGTSGADGGDGGREGVGASESLPSAFPTGYAAFYCMKYLISQGQYADFLNLLENPGARYAGDKYGVDRYTIRWSGTENEYVADAPDRACNWLSWEDGARYAAWAGLRPMTELEYEKACRGTETPVANEYAWGTDSIERQTEHAGTDGSGSETAIPEDANCNFNGGIGGPVRVGIYAATASAAGEVTRERAGATYWGIMEMSGNLWERMVDVRNGRAFEGTHGDGTLALPFDWPGADAVGAGIRGGAWPGSSDVARVSDRGNAANVLTARHRAYGWRGVRLAPSGAGD